MLEILDHLTTDHGDGINHVSRLALTDGEHGLRLVEERDDDPGGRPPTPAGPHDDPAVYAAELDALARHLRCLGLDAASEPAASLVRVRPRRREPHARAVTLSLRPDLYRQYLDVLEAEFEAIGGDPVEHAWRSWCRLVVHALTGTSAEPRHLRLARSDDGLVALLADAPAAQHRWSAEPGE
ncbi:hypothetical protein GCM10023200_54330 [Actinomycetospora chlora]|uniref:DUF2470 domain-containing protein n=1 Tax=Actinomycetospora chlora TaxID=663608 RepID=A0ABP9CEV1_9PSEU